MEINRLTSSDTLKYSDYGDYLFDMLNLLDLRLLRTFRIRQGWIKAESETRGLFISEEEIESVLNLEYESVDPNYSEIELIETRINRSTAIIDQKLSNSQNREYFPLLRLVNIFGLTSYELDILVMAVAPEINTKYGRIYAYFNDYMTKKTPSVDLAIQILFDNVKDRLNGLQFFSPNQPLFRYKLIRLTDAQEEGSFLNRRFVLDDRIRRFVLDDMGLDEKLARIARVEYPDQIISHATIPSELKEQVQKLISQAGEDAVKVIYWLYGKANDDKKIVVREICEAVKLPLVIADMSDIIYDPEPQKVIEELFREANLQSALVLISGGEHLVNGDEKVELVKRFLLQTFYEISWITFICGEVLWVPEEKNEMLQWIPYEFKLPQCSERKRIWRESLDRSISDAEIEVISQRYPFSEGQIKKTIAYVRDFINKGKLTLDEVCKACHLQTYQNLGVFSTKVTPRYHWNDIVLPDDTKRQLREVCNYLKYQHLVYCDWGFEQKLVLGRGLNILFSGPSGTGKTMAADIVGAELKLAIYKINLATVVSKYIGETEKNLSRIFKETTPGNGILFFDEADALFGKRSEVKDAHDRYANIEINFLLQRMEEHEGIVILATNFIKNLDDAFARRMFMTVEFPFPEENQREQIWRNAFPPNAPLAKDLDYRFLAERFKLTGGNIKNTVLTAAFYAAVEASEIQMRHLIRAVKRELQKMGKLCVKADFGQYYELLESGGSDE